MIETAVTLTESELERIYSPIGNESAYPELPGVIADIIAERLATVTNERDLLRRGGAALGNTLKFWMDLVVEVTGSEDCMWGDGDGDWGAVAERLAEMKTTTPDAPEVPAAGGGDRG